MSGAQRLILTTLIGAGVVGGPSLASAHDALTLTQGSIVSGGGRMDAGESLRAITTMGQPIGGGAASHTVILEGGYQPELQPLSESLKAIAVEGTSDEPVASVVVNGVAATRQDRAFRAEGVRLLEGPNTIVVTATDFGGNRSHREITVWLDTQPPARPTVAATPPTITGSTITLTGTKTPGTSVWINGAEVVLLDKLTTWSATVTLVEGDNVISVVTQDVVDHRSTAATAIVVVDNLPPVVTATAPAITNLTPVLVRGTVDDHLTRVEANGINATRSGRRFEVAVPLIEGPNAITLTATSPNGHVSTTTLTVTLGTIPTITTITPADHSQLYAGTPVTIRAEATDKEDNPIEYQLWLDGQLLVDWAQQASSVWPPDPTQYGLHVIEVRARDAFGGFASKQAEAFVVLTPLTPSP